MKPTCNTHSSLLGTGIVSDSGFLNRPDSIDGSCPSFWSFLSIFGLTLDLPQGSLCGADGPLEATMEGRRLSPVEVFLPMVVCVCVIGGKKIEEKMKASRAGRGEED